MKTQRFHVILALILALSFLGAADRQYSNVYIDLSPFPYKKPTEVKLRG